MAAAVAVVAVVVAVVMVVVVVSPLASYIYYALEFFIKNTTLI